MTVTSKLSVRKITPVILSGGAGTRLWPLSRGLRPKQFLALSGENSMFAETVARVANDEFNPPLIVCNDDHRFLVAEELRHAGHAWQDIILEPTARNTAPAIAAAALHLIESDADALMAVLPSDHVIGDPNALHIALKNAAKIADTGHLVAFGIPPIQPETGYGYIRRGAALVDNIGFTVEQFVEKPDVATAADYISAGNYLWNSGIFVFSARAYLEELSVYYPKIVDCCRRAVSAAARDLDFVRLDEKAFGEAESISIDYAVMEKTTRAAVIPLETTWSDVGSWAALWKLGSKDADGNVLVGDSISIDARGNYIRSDKPIVAAVGVDDLIIIATDDAVLVIPKDRAQDVRLAVDALAESGREEIFSHTRVYRPWGHYQNLDSGDGFLVKQLVVKPGAKLSLQRHRHRAEHWVVVEGVARVTNGDDTFELTANQSTYIPPDTQHRLENPSDQPLRLIEVQSGSYIGEDDIIRLDDTYGRH